ncbi:MAG: hypothetical protein F4Z57_08435 [Gemmatimonadetes bacterium]|nr:hypothetical protein [Gemmatimonadota bacterium]MYC71041.1 hypothetical protein [Gemmatimonadota bacterium]MYI61116.1 hypothetical protein [Gemmatimonadota bacterium]
MSNRDSINELLHTTALAIGFDLVVERGTEATALPYGVFSHVATSEYETWSGRIPLEHVFAVMIYAATQETVRQYDDALQEALAESPAFVRSLFVSEKVDVDPEGPVESAHVLERQYVFKACGEVHGR